MHVEKHTLAERIDFWFLDYSIIPLYIQQLYITSVDNGHKGSPALIRKLKDAANGVSDADLGKLFLFPPPSSLVCMYVWSMYGHTVCNQYM